MVFSSIPFLYYFLPCVLLAYFLAPKKVKNSILLLASFIFYAWGEPVYVLLMLCSIFIGYLSGILIEESSVRAWRIASPGRILAGSVFVFLGIFVYFKYTDFLIGNVNGILGTAIPLQKIILPIGISFYTFQILSYLVDVYRKEVSAQRNFITLAAYITMFPQLIAGPIVRYSAVERELKDRSVTWDKVEYGISRFTIGLSKKVLIANELGELCDIFRTSNDKSVVFYWIYAVAYMIHIYFDFSGYSDMAIGLGRLLGFTFPENFNYPYISGSITEFWRRWHMSLGTWFRDYLYIPLGGNRVSRIKWYRNIFFVWLFTGLWHGASWNFVVWGLYFGFLLVIEKNRLLAYLEKNRWISHIYVLVLIMFSFVIFNATDLRQGIQDIGCILGFGDIPVFSRETAYYLQSYGLTLLLGVIGSTPVVWKLGNMVKDKHSVWYCILKPIWIVGLLLLSTAYLVDGSFNPFLYFRF